MTFPSNVQMMISFSLVGFGIAVGYFIGRYAEYKRTQNCLKGKR